MMETLIILIILIIALCKESHEKRKADSYALWALNRENRSRQDERC